MQNYRILIVDDDELLAFHYKVVVERLGYTVIGVALDGESALSMAREYSPDIVLLDIVLPGNIDGLDVGKVLSEQLEIPFIYITGHLTDEFIDRARVSKPYGYLTKPVGEIELAATISIGLYKAHAEKYLKEIWLLCESMESICDPIISLDLARHIIFLNKAAKQVMLSQADMIGDVFQNNLLPLDDYEWLKISHRIDECANKGVPVLDDNLISLCDEHDNKQLFNVLTVPLKNKTGEIIGTVLMLRDISEIKTLEFALERERDFIRDVLDEIDALVIVLDRQGNIFSVNNACLKMTGYVSEDLIGCKIWDVLFMDDDRNMFQSVFENFSFANKERHYETQFRRKLPGDLIISWSLSGLHGGVDDFKHILVTGVDVTVRKNNEQALTLSEQRFRDVVDAAGGFVWETDELWRYTYVSERMKTILGYNQHEVIGRTPACFFYDHALSEHNAAWPFNTICNIDSFRGIEHEYKAKSGDLVWLRMSGAPILDEHKQVVGYRGVGEDITERKRIEREIEDLATRDVLTHLPNRLLLNDRVSQGIYQARRTGEKLAMFFIDLDQFKHINDSLGHDVGDILLVKVASRLENCIRQQDTVSRLGGDEFIVVLCGLNSIDEIIHIAQKILTSVSRPLTLNGYDLIITCSIGISLFPSDGADIQALLSHSDTAMYHAKSSGRNNFQFYSSEMNVTAVARQKLENNLRISSENNDFYLVYQPKVNIVTGKIVGAEALLRWQQSDEAPISPDEFVPVAERIGLINHIGEWVLKTACEQNKKWRSYGYRPIKIGVNLSVVQIGGDIVNAVENILRSTGLEPAALDLEITENLMMDNIQENIDILSGLRRMGISISMDDFGTGYSSLSYLKRFPLDTLKIDKSFVREITINKSDVAIVSSIITMAKSLGLVVLAEGVEFKRQLDILEGMGCDEYQGFYFGKPVLASEFEREFLAAGV